MTIGLTHNTDLWRVQLALSGFNSAVSSVLVERSANEILWSTVRGGTALPIVSGAGSLDDYEYFAAADGSLTTFYRVTTVDPPPGLLLHGVAGDYASTPDDASLDITGDIDLRAEVTFGPIATQVLVSKANTAGSLSYRFNARSDGDLQLLASSDGSTFQVNEFSTAPVPAVAGDRIALRVTFDVDDGAGGWAIRFWTAPSIDTPESDWTQLGDPIDNGGGGTFTTFVSTAALTVGAGADDGSAAPFSGTIHAAEVRNGIGGTAAADPDFTAEGSGTTNFADDAGRTWTVNGTAAIVTFETASIAVTQSDVVLKSIRYTMLNRAVKLGDYTDLDRPGQTGVFAVTGRSFPVATTDVNSSERVGFEFVTETEDEARRIKLLLALGDILYLQSPAEVNVVRPPRSMYLVADSSAVGRIGHTARRRHTVPFTEVAAPSPLVVGGTLTWGNVFNTFGSWQQLISANPSWSDLLATVGDPDDLVTL